MKKIICLYLITLPFIIHAQWASRGSDILETGRFIESVSVVDALTVWAVTFDEITFNNPTNEWTRTTDGGATWQTGSLPLTDPSFCTYTIFAMDDSTAWAGVGSQPSFNKGAIYKTTDGGLNWDEQITFDDRACGQIHFWNESEGITFTAARLGVDNELQVWKTIDGGTNWSPISIPSPMDNETVLGFSGNGLMDIFNDQVWIPTTRGRVYHSSDRGNTWDVHEVTSSNRGLTSIAFANELEGMAVSAISSGGAILNNMAFTTTDGGLNWTTITVPASPLAGMVEYIPETDATYLLTSYANGDKNIAFTHDAGLSWKETIGPGIWSMEFLSPTVGWAGSSILNNGKQGLYRFTSDFSADHINVNTFAGIGSEGNRLNSKERAQFYNPKGMAIDDQGNIYISDDYNHTIKRITPNGNVDVIAGSNAAYQAINGPFFRPQDILIDNNGDILVADGNNVQIKKITLNNGVYDVTTFAGTGEVGEADGPKETATFSWPNSLAQDSDGNIYIGDLNAIRKIDTAGMVSTLAGTQTPGFEDGTGSAAAFNVVWGIDTDSAGFVYAADLANHAIRKISPQGEVTTLAGSGFAAYQDGIGTNAYFSWPEDVAVNDAGEIYVADGTNGVIRKIEPDGTTTTFVGNKYIDFFVGQPGPETIDGEGTYATFNRMRGILIQPNGNLLLSQWGTDAIQEIQIGTPSHPLVVLESNIENPWGISHIRQLEPFIFFSQVQNTSSIPIKNVQLKIWITQNGSPVFFKESQIENIQPGSFETLLVDDFFEPSDSGYYVVEFRYYQGDDLFYTEFRDIQVSDQFMDHGDGGFYYGDSYINFFPDFLGSYGVSYEFNQADSLKGFAISMSSIDSTLALQFGLYKITDNAPPEAIYFTPEINADSLLTNRLFRQYILPTPFPIEAGEYLLVVKENNPGSMFLSFDNAIISENNWIQDFSSGDWGRLQDLFNGFQDVHFMIRPLLSQPTISTSTHQAGHTPIQLAAAPNPFIDQLSVSLSQDARTPAALQLLDISGKVIDSFTLRPGQSQTLQLEHLSHGIYLLNDLISTQTMKIIKH